MQTPTLPPPPSNHYRLWHIDGTSEIVKFGDCTDMTFAPHQGCESDETYLLEGYRFHGWNGWQLGGMS